MGILDFFSRNKDSKLKYYEKVLQDWILSKERKEMLVAESYYQGNHDILQRKRTVINEQGKLSPVDNLPNNKLVDNQLRKLVDQKTNFALGKPITIATSNESYLEELNKIFDKKMFRQMRLLGHNAISHGLAWLYPYYNEIGEFKVKIFPAYEILPIWSDGSHTELFEILRLYSDNIIQPNGTVKSVQILEIYTLTGVDRFIWNEKTLIPHPSEAHTDYLNIGSETYNWERLPIIPFKYNCNEIPLIRNVKTLQDSLNQVLSDFQNNMEEDPRSTILVLKNYDGTNLSEFRRNLATLGVIPVQTVDGVQGGVDTLKIEVNATNYQAILMQLKRAIVENGYGFDAKEERMDGDPNQMNIESMYTDIDLDVDAMETEFQAGFEELKWFIDQHLVHIGKEDFTDEKVEFIFNRDIFINEDAIIDNCVKSVGIISNQTIVARHPWVADLQRELRQIEEDKQLELDEMAAQQSLMNDATGGSDVD